MMEMRIGIQQAVTMPVFDQMMCAVLSGDYSLQYAEELARLSTTGEARVKKIRTVINKMATCNPLLPYMREHAVETELALKNVNDRRVVYVAVMCATYSFAYHMVSVIGKYLHVQDEVTTGTVKAKLAELYGSVRTLEIAMNAVLPMMVEAGMLVRKKAGVYAMGSMGNHTDYAHELYREAFLVNNPAYTRDTMDVSNPFFEFIE